MKGLRAWLKHRNKAERAALASLAKVSAEFLRQCSMGHRNASAETAAAVEVAAQQLGAPLRRGDVSRTCNACPYYNTAIEKEDLV